MLADMTVTRCVCICCMSLCVCVGVDVCAFVAVGVGVACPDYQLHHENYQQTRAQPGLLAHRSTQQQARCLRLQYIPLPQVLAVWVNATLRRFTPAMPHHTNPLL